MCRVLLNSEYLHHFQDCPSCPPTPTPHNLRTAGLELDSAPAGRLPVTRRLTIDFRWLTTNRPLLKRDLPSGH